MAKVPGTDIDKPTVDLSEASTGFEMARVAKRALHKAGVPANVVRSALEATAPKLVDPDGMRTALAEYVEVAP